MNEDLGRIGFAGLGLMGLPMAQNLLAAGADVTVFNRTRAKAAPLEAAGAAVADDLADLGRRVRGGILVICVLDTPAMEEVIAALPPDCLRGTLVIDMGTTTLAATRAAAEHIRAHGGAFVDAPVSGGEVGARAGTLSIMAGGAPGDIARAAPVFDVLGASTTHIGPTGAGQIAKAANQIIVATTVAIVGEAMMLAHTAGADTARMRDALLGGFAASRVLELHGQRMIDRDFTPGGRARTQAKDLAQATELAQSLSLSLPVMERCSGLWHQMVADGMGELDQAGYLAFVEAAQEKG